MKKLDGKIKLGALVSSGKDSNYAMYKMIKEGYPIVCLMTIKSENPDSYMFQSQCANFTKVQSKCLEIPLITKTTKGVKEEELKDLKILLMRTKEKYKIKGIVTGALYSNYQKDRIERICKELKLQVFSPLWHMDEEKEMKELIDEKFKFILVKVAAMGMDESWLGRIIIWEDVDKLALLNRKFGMNISFEGGEAESLVLDCPLYKYKIKILGGEKIMENSFTGVYNITKFRLEEKHL